MNTREKAEEYRLSHWAGIIRERKASGKSIRAYCRQSGIHENVYYYWQRKLRETACEGLAIGERPQTPAPAGWALCTLESRLPVIAEQGEPAPPKQLTAEVNGVRITVNSGYPVEQLAELLRELVKSC